ncbi:hypothetical protein [Neisseria sp.]|uniref:protein MIGRI n=1 Tax=Neisseria sp. TaxID=192066 RepID=UPI00359FB166
MIGRILRTAFVLALIAFVIHRLFSRRQKRAVREAAQISAWVLLGVSLLALAWYLAGLY